MAQPYLWPSLITPTSITFKLYGATIFDDGTGHELELFVHGQPNYFQYENGLPRHSISEPFNSIRYTVDISENAFTINNLSSNTTYIPVLYINSLQFGIPNVVSGRILGTSYSTTGFSVTIGGNIISNVQATSSEISATVIQLPDNIFPDLIAYNTYRAIANSEIKSITPNNVVFNNTTRTISGLSPGTPYTVFFERVFTDTMRLMDDPTDTTYEIVLRSTAVSVSTSKTAPAAPTITSITSASSGQLSVAFTAPDSNGGEPITTYQYSLNGGLWINRNLGTTEIPLLISGLNNGTPYQVKIRAVNSIGPGTESNMMTGTPTAPVMPPTINNPINVSASSSSLSLAITGTNLPASMTSTAMNGSTAVSVYFRTFIPAAPNDASYVYTRSTSTSATLVISGLASSTTYSFTLDMSNSPPSNFVTRGGSGSTTAPASPPPPTPLSAPSGLTMTTSTSNRLSFSWNTVTNATGYTATLTGSGGFTQTKVLSGASITTEFINLTAGRLYTLSVTATSTNSSFTNSLAVSLPARTRLAVPGVTVTGSTTTSITVSWTAVTAEGQTVSYSVSRPGVTLPSTTSTTAEFTGLEPGTSYVISVEPSATNYVASGSGSTAPFTTPTLSNYTQSLLADVSAGTITRAQFKTQFAATNAVQATASKVLATGANIRKLADPASILAGVTIPENASVNMFLVKSGSTISTTGIDTSKYIYFPSTPSSSIQYTVGTTVIAFNSTGTMFVDDIQRDLGYIHVFEGKGYRYVAKGSGLYEPIPAPSAPTINSITSGSGQLTVAFTAPDSVGITNYEYSTNDGSTWTARDPADTTSPIVITGLAAGTTYQVRVRAVNASGSGTSSETTPGTTAADGGEGVICFFGNARVLTPNGYRRMDSLAVGDMVVTPSGKTVAIERVKVCIAEAGPNTNPYVIPVGVFEATHRVLISPDHKVCLADGRKVEAKKLGLVQEERDGMLTYYNLELTGQADMVVSGVPVESLAHIRRVVVTMDQFAALMAKKYGPAAMSPTVLANMKRTCRMLADGRVEVPVMRR
jgi:hypothetical protein